MIIIKYALIKNSNGKVVSGGASPIEATDDHTLVECELNLPIWDLSYNFDTKKFFVSNDTLMKKIKIKRNELLSVTDYTQLDDSTYAGTKEEWKTYRQKLRDITKGVTDPDTIVFPEEPK